MKRRIKWDEYIKTKVSNFQYRDRLNWFTDLCSRTASGLVDSIVHRVQTLRDNERGSRLGKTILDEPIDLGGWDKKLRRK